MSAVVLFVELKMAPGQRDAFVALARQHRDRVLKDEPGCVQFDISVPDRTSDIVRLYEVYTDQSAVDHHMTTAYMAAYREATGPMVIDRAITQAVMSND